MADPVLFQLKFPQVLSDTKELRQAGKLDEVEFYLKKVVKKFPNAGRAYFEIVDFLSEQKRFAEARNYLIKINSIMQKSSEPDVSDFIGVRIRLIQNYLATQSFSEALYYCLKTLNMPFCPYNVGVYYAQIAALQGDKVEYIERLKRCKAQFSDSSEMHIALASGLFETGAANEGDKVLEAALAAFPHNIAIMLHYARAAHSRSDWIEAARRWAMVRDEFPLNPEGFEIGAEALRQLSKYDEADEVERQHPGERAILWPAR